MEASPRRVAPRVVEMTLVTAVLLAGASVAADTVRTQDPGTTRITASSREQLEARLPADILAQVRDDAELDMIIAPTHEYPAHPAYVDATIKYACQAQLDAQGQLINYTAGQPFPYSEWAKKATGHKCDLKPDDPQLALKLAWNVNFRWQGPGLNLPHFGFSYMRNNGNETWRVSQGEYRRTYFTHRADLPGHTLGPDSDVEWAEFFDVKTPFDLRGTMFLLFRYNYTAGQEYKEDQTYAYIPSLRRVRRVAATQKSDSLLGTEFTLEDFYLFAGYVWDHKWEFQGEHSYLGIMNTRRTCFPNNMSAEEAKRSEGQTRLGTREEWESCRFGPYGAMPFRGDTWENRTVVQLDDIPRREGHPYSRKKLFYDKETLQPLYAMAYDRAGQPMRMIMSVRRWSEESEVPENRGQYVAADAAVLIANLQNGNSHVGSFWNGNVRQFDGDTTRRYYDTSRLKKEGR